MTKVRELFTLLDRQGERPAPDTTAGAVAKVGGPGPGRTGPADAVTAAEAGPSPAPVTEPGSRPIELRHRVAATAALMAIGAVFGGLMLARGHLLVGVMLVLTHDVLAPVVLLVMPALVDHARRRQSH